MCALAEFAASARHADLPGVVADQAKQSLLDVLGIAIAGAGLGESGAAALAYARAVGRGGDAGVWVTGERLSAPLAALANAVHARALDYDDIIEFPQIHVAVCVVPAVLAVAESMPAGADGRRVLTAIAVGCEVQARLAAAIAPYFGPGLPTMLGSQLFGYFSAAAACAHVLGLDAARTRSALGLAFMQAAGTEEMVVHAAASDGKVLYAGLSNQGGAQAALMARHGVVADGEPFTGQAGLFAACYGGRYAADPLDRGLGEEYVSPRRCFKAMPGTLVAHAFAEAAITLCREHAITPDDIAEVVLSVGPWGRVMCEPDAMRRAPPTATAAMNSIPFIVAKAIANGHVALEDFGAGGRAEPRAAGLAARIAHVVQPELANPAGLEPGIVAIRTAAGATFRLRVDHPRGHPSRPLSFADVAEKFRRNAACGPRPLGSQVEATIERVQRLESLDHVTALLAPLAG